MGAEREPVAELNTVRPAAAMLRDDAFGVLLRGEQKRADRRRNRGSNFRNAIFADYAWATGHVRDQAHRGCTAFNGQCGFFYAADAANLDSWRASGMHSSGPPRSFAVRYPDILYLGGVLEEPSTFALLHVKPVNRAAFIREHLFQVSGRKRFRRIGAGFISEAPDRIDIIVLGYNLEELR